MKFCYTLLAVAAVAIPLHASIIDFEGLQDGESVGDYYNAGLGGFGSGPGTNYGITFSSDAYAYIQSNQSAGNVTDTGLFGGEPSPYTALLFCQAADGVCADVQNAETINVAGGFGGAFSLYYSAPDAFSSGGTFDIWSGINGTGTNLGTWNLTTTATSDATGDGNCDEYGAASNPDGAGLFCPFVQVNAAFSGTAQSVVFTGATGVMAFDDIAFGSEASTPEPATWFLLAAGLAGIAFNRKLRRARA